MTSRLLVRANLPVALASVLLVGFAASCARVNSSGESGTFCEPGRRTCDGSTVIACSADGLRFSQETTCAAGCSNGSCILPLCQAGETRCEGNVLKQCSTDGTSLDVIQVCPRGCDTGTAACLADVCPPGARQCESGTTLKACKLDGSGWSSTRCDQAMPSGGRCVTDGANNNNLNSYCERYSCSPTTLRCDGLEVMRCNNDGAGETAVTMCEHSCSAGRCVDGICAPGTFRCSSDGSAVERCNDLGTAWNSQSCLVDGIGACALTTSGDGATSASCVQPICSPNVKVCRGSDWVECAEDGLSETVLATCPFGCNASTGCRAAACAAGAQRCSGRSRQTCAPDRTGYLTDQYCLAGCAAGSGSTAACVPIVCAPYDARCGSDQVTTECCRVDGSGWDAATCAMLPQRESDLCATSAPACTDSGRRCVDATIQICASGEGGPTYATVGQCLGSCSNTSCDASGQCGPFSLSLAAGQGALAADGRSTYLVRSGAMLGPDGAAVPDGTLVNVWIDGATLVSADSNASVPGLQLTVTNGGVQFVVQAPALAGQATIGARVRQLSSCAASLSLTFGGVSGP
jgi:hypothetical protein